jgi:hypothetical protein
LLRFCQSLRTLSVAGSAARIVHLAGNQAQAVGIGPLMRTSMALSPEGPNITRLVLALTCG